jgi:hypothetical protein
MATRDESKIPIGIFFQKEKPNFTDQITALSDGPLVSKKFNPNRLESVFAR